MRLEREESFCSGCSKADCLAVCPYYSGEETQKLLNCKHCDIESAPCRMSCSSGAIYPISDSVLAIDPELCDMCGNCIKACKEKAIIIKQRKPVKCDLCASNDFVQKCVLECNYSAIKLISEKHEQEEISRL